MSIFFLKDTVEDKISEKFFYQFLNEVRNKFKTKIISIFDNHDFKNNNDIYILWSSTLNSKYKEFLYFNFKKFNCKFLIIEHSVFFRNVKIRLGINGFDYNNMFSQNNNQITKIKNNFILSNNTFNNTIIFTQRTKSYLHSSNQLDWIENKIMENNIIKNVYLKPHPLQLSNSNFLKILNSFCMKNNIVLVDNVKKLLNYNSTVINFNSSPLVKAAYHNLNFIGYENHYLYKIKNQQFPEFQKKILAFELEINKINYEKLFSRLF